MTRISLVLLSGTALMAAASLTTPTLAQSDPHQPANNGSTAASMTVPPGQVGPGADPGTMAANAGVRSNIQATQDQNAASQAQYQQDLAAYDTAVQAHGHAVARQDVRYARQQRAYADAMAAWRIQDAACCRVHQDACKAPAPDPTDYY